MSKKQSNPPPQGERPAPPPAPPPRFSDGRDLQVMTSTRLQLINRMKEACSNCPHFRATAENLKTLEIKLPDTMIVARCTCDDPGEGRCPQHGRECDLQNRALKAEARVKELEGLIGEAKDGSKDARRRGPGWGHE